MKASIKDVKYTNPGSDRKAIKRKKFFGGVELELLTLTEETVEYRYVWNGVPGKPSTLAIKKDKNGKKYFGTTTKTYLTGFQSVN